MYDFFRRWCRHGYVRELYQWLRRIERQRQGRPAEPRAGIIDAQSVDGADTVTGDTRGYDGAKSRDGRKRHVLTDTLGLLLEVTVTPANAHDSMAAPELLERFMAAPGRLLKLVWADSTYQGQALAQAFARHGVKVEVVRRSDGQTGFVVLARRWVVERTLGWLSRARRLNRDHERGGPLPDAHPATGPPCAPRATAPHQRLSDDKPEGVRARAGRSVSAGRVHQGDGGRRSRRSPLIPDRHHSTTPRSWDARRELAIWRMSIQILASTLIPLRRLRSGTPYLGVKWAKSGPPGRPRIAPGSLLRKERTTAGRPFGGDQ